MSGQNIDAFELLAAKLSAQEAEVRAALPRGSRENILGIGRQVLLLDVGIGVFVRGSAYKAPVAHNPRFQVNVDFLVGDRTRLDAHAAYMSYGDRVTVNQNAGDAQGALSVVSLAKILKGVDLVRDVPDETTPAFVASQEELDFVKEFAENPVNNWASFHFVGQPITGMEVTMLG